LEAVHAGTSGDGGTTTRLASSSKLEAIKAGFGGACQQELFAIAPANGVVTALSLTVDALEQARDLAKRAIQGEKSAQAWPYLTWCMHVAAS
jgi:hypothetical protein